MKIKKQTYALETYLKKIIGESIRSDQDVQRLSGQWDNNMVNELVVTVLTNDYIPPIILGEELLKNTTQLWIIDGLQRSTSLSKFRYGNYKISSSVEEYMIEYQRDLVDDEGRKIRDQKGNIKKETLEFDIRNKSYDDLPVELKTLFNDYQIETTIHLDCDMKIISKLVRRYNNHKSMNTAQKAFTYIDNFARNIRDITKNHRFFKDCGSYTQKERESGVLERILVESVMAMFHLESWQKQSKKMGTFLNTHATNEEFQKLKDNLDRLELIVEDEISGLFNSKNSFIWFALFDKFTKLGLDDKKFGEFLRAFIRHLHNKKVNDISFDELDLNKSTKDRSIVIKKIDTLELLMLEYFNVEKPTETGDRDIQQFVKENIDEEITDEDIALYKDILSDLTLNVDNNTRLLDEQNMPSLIAIVAYACKKDMDIDDWFIDFFEKNSIYRENQKENFIYMVSSIEKNIEEEKKNEYRIK